jgi:hypothetical protein
MRRLFFAVCCTAATLAAQPSRAIVGLAGWPNKFPIEDVTLSFTLDAPLAKSYAAVKAAFAELKVPIDMDNPAGGLVGVQLAKAQTKFAGYRMSRIFDCGQKSTMGPNADSYRLTIVFLALLDSLDASHTKLRVGFVASAVPSSGSRTDALQCGSTGAIEAKLAELASARLK